MADPVQLTDLDVITRYSIAVRRATADRDELIETLRSDLTWLERGLRRGRTVDAEPEPEVADVTDAEYDAAAEPAPEPAPRRTPIRRMPAKVTPARRAAAKKTAATPAAKKTAANKTAAKKTTSRASR
jgi:hypothetical protein